MTKPLSYADSGVSIDAGDELVERIKPFAKKTLIPGVLGSIGGFGALFEISKDYKEPVLVTGTDGVGTKLKLAFSSRYGNGRRGYQTQTRFPAESSRHRRPGLGRHERQ